MGHVDKMKERLHFYQEQTGTVIYQARLTVLFEEIIKKCLYGKKFHFL